MKEVSLKIKVLENGDKSFVPVYMTGGSAGMDIHSAEDMHIIQYETKMIRTGLSMVVPMGYEIQVRSRSGLAKNHGVFVTNGIGTIDSDYRGEVCVLLTCNGADVLDNKGFTIARGDRIAQIVLSKVEQAQVVIVDSLDETSRGEGGFGSTKYSHRDEVVR